MLANLCYDKRYPRVYMFHIHVLAVIAYIRACQRNIIHVNHKYIASCRHKKHRWR